MPGPETEQYRIGLTERTAGTGPDDNTNDSLRLSVVRSGVESSPLYGQVAIGFIHIDYEADQITVLAGVPIDLTGNPNQIRLTLAKTDPTSNAITASFTYLKDGVAIGGDTLATTPTEFEIFHGEDFTRAQFDALMIPTEVAPPFAAKLVTGSPVSIRQDVSTPSTPFTLDFDYLFETLTGALSVSLNDIALDTIIAPSTLQTNFLTASIPIDTPLLGLADIPLKFELDGPTGSTLLLDDIMFPDLANGDFQAGSLTAWNVTTTGNGTVGAIRAQVPEPTTLALFGIGLAGLGFAKRRKVC